MSLSNFAVFARGLPRLVGCHWSEAKSFRLMYTYAAGKGTIFGGNVRRPGHARQIVLVSMAEQSYSYWTALQ